MDVAAILQALLGAGAPAAAPSVAGPLDATFAALFAAAAGTTPAAGATPGTKLARPDEHVDVPPAPTADAQALSLAGAAIAAVSPPVVPSATPVAASPPAAAPATDATTVAASPTVERPCVPAVAEQVPVPAAPADPAAPLARAQATPQSAAPAATPVSVEPDVPAADEAQASAEPAAPTRVAEHAPSPTPPLRHKLPTLPPAALPDAKPSEEAPAATAKPVPHAETATGTQHDDAVAESVEPAVDRVAPRRTVEPAAAPASAGHTAAAAVQASGARTEADVGRESGHPSGALPAARRASEGSEATVKGGDTAPSPTPLSPSTTTREHERVEIATPEAPAARAGAEHDVERLVRLDELRPVRVRDGGEMRMEVSPEGLGRVEVRVAVRADAVHATLYAQQDHARDALMAHRPALEAALGRSHLKLETFSVGVGQHELGDSDRRTPQSEPAPDEPGPRRPSGPVAAAAPATTLTPAASGGLSLRA